MKPFYRSCLLVAPWLALTIPVTGFLACNTLPFLFFANWKPWLLAEARSTTGSNTALFLKNTGSFAGSDTFVFVRDPTLSATKPIRVGGDYASDGPVKIIGAAWSKDGSVIAVRVKAGASAGHGFSTVYGIYWIDAYDFRRHRIVSEGTTLEERSKVIASLLAKRGGKNALDLDKLWESAKDNLSDVNVQTFDTSDPGKSARLLPDR